MAAYFRDSLGCGQVVNAGNWKTADVIRLEDCERYSYTCAEVVATNRYFGGVHKGQHATWAIVTAISSPVPPCSRTLATSR